ncbi:MAG: phage major capsid protein [Oscillospiraceae bacterium]|nr:phage major capsid protein [Oscillospiraceae bacterium]
MNMGYDNLRLEKGMYRQEGMSFTQVLESLDPSENYRGTALEGTDAFQRQLKRFGIRAKGAGSSPVEKFFRTMDSAVLFPEYIARTVRQGMEEHDILPAITATTTVIDAMDYRSIYSNPTDEDKQLENVEEGGAIPETEVKTKEHLVRLTKRGRMLVASYEALRFQKLDLFGVMLRQIGAHIQKQQLADAVNVLVNGDGNDNAAAVFTVGTEPISGSKGSLGYDQLVEFWGQFDPYTMNTILCSTGTMTKLLKVPELQNPLTGLNFQGTGKLTTPLGAQLHRTGAVAEGMIIGLDNRYALELVRAGDVLVEYDKLIDRQLERAAITSISGFGKICDGAACVLNV